jgi:hypothetical protein
MLNFSVWYRYSLPTVYLLILNTYTIAYNKRINLLQNNKQDEENETFSTDARMEPCVA